VLLAANSGGHVNLFDESNTRRRIHAAPAGINEMAVMNRGVLLACNQHQLRLLPLLEDE
jgi:hypothetical protein